MQATHDRTQHERIVAAWDAAQPRIERRADCWIWTGSLSSKGYGRVPTANQGTRLLHRIAYIATYGPITPGLVVDHLCHNADTSCPGGDDCPHRRCCNPAHLEAVESGVNVLRSLNPPTSANHAKTVCVRGHALTPDNVEIRMRDGRQRRRCRACRHDEWARRVRR